MAQPTPYERSASFSNWQTANPSAPPPGSDLDAEFNAIKTTLDQLLSNLAQIQRDDGDLGNETVGREQLKADLNIGFNPPEAWESGVVYAATVDSVFFAGKFYRCIEDHTSDVFADDLAAEKWELIADLTSVPLATAEQIGLTPTGDVTSENVQAAIAELAIDVETEMASNTVTPIGGAKTSRVLITGNNTITAFDTVANRLRYVRFSGTPVLTHGAALLLFGSADIAVEAGDSAVFASDSLGAWRLLLYRRANDIPGSLVEQTVASAATTDIGAVRSRRVAISGTATITSFGTAAHRLVYGRFTGAATLTHNGTSLALPGGKNIVAADGDRFIAASDASGNWRVYEYTRADGQPLTTALATLASASTVDLGSVHAEEISISGTTTITSFGSTAPTGARKDVRFEGALTLTHNASSLILPTGANILTVAGDTASFRHEGSGNWRCLHYQRADGFTPRFTRAIASARGLVIKPTSDTAVDIDASEVVLVDSLGRTVAHTNVDLTANITDTGVINGVQVARATNKWLAVYILSDGTNVGAFLVEHGTALSAPAGYVYSGFFGYVRTNATGSGNLLRTVQRGRKVRYTPIAGSSTTELPVMDSGQTSASWRAISVSDFVPPTASSIVVRGVMYSGTGAVLVLATNDQYSPTPNDTSNAALCSTILDVVTLEMLLESSNIYMSCNGSAASSNYISCYGWEDAVNAC